MSTPIRPLPRSPVHETSPALRHHCKSISLAHCRTAPDPIPHRLADAGPSSWHEARRRHDFSYLLWLFDSHCHRAALPVAADLPRRAGEYVATLAAPGFRTGALDALHPGACDDPDRLAIRLVPRLVGFLLLSVSAADACLRQRRRGQGYRRLASGGGVDTARLHRTARARGIGAPVRLSRPRHPAHAAGVVVSSNSDQAAPCGPGAFSSSFDHLDGSEGETPWRNRNGASRLRPNCRSRSRQGRSRQSNSPKTRLHGSNATMARSTRSARAILSAPCRRRAPRTRASPAARGNRCSAYRLR